VSDGSTPDGQTCAWYAPGASGGVNIDGGAAVDPETGMLYVASQSGLSTIEVDKDPCSQFNFSSPHDSCGLLGAMPPPAGYEPPERRGRGGFGARTPTSIGGISILKPQEHGGITAYDMSTGDKAWWIPNGGQMIEQQTDDPLFAGVDLPMTHNARGHAQVITTSSLVIYGTGRSGGPPRVEPRLHAVDKATGRSVGSVEIPSKTSAVPMTFLHDGKQYIVFATGAGRSAALIALTLPDER
jgi:glucose dehydrogenase